MACALRAMRQRRYGSYADTPRAGSACTQQATIGAFSNRACLAGPERSLRESAVTMAGLPAAPKPPKYERWLAIIGATIGVVSFAITLANHELDDHQREQTFETELTEQISAPAADALATSEDIVGGALAAASDKPKPEAEEREYLRVRKLWSQASTKVSAKLFAYYKDARSITREWKRFRLAVSTMLYLSTAGRDRAGGVRALRDYLGDGAHGINNFEVLRDQPTVPGFLPVFNEVSAELSRRLDRLSREIVDAHPRGFSNWIPFI